VSLRMSSSCFVMQNLIKSFMLSWTVNAEEQGEHQTRSSPNPKPTLTRRILSKYSWHEQLSKLSLLDSCSVRSRIGFSTSCFIMSPCICALFCFRSSRNIRKEAANAIK
jgi:hypothetical protein